MSNGNLLELLSRNDSRADAKKRGVHQSQKPQLDKLLTRQDSITDAKNRGVHLSQNPKYETTDQERIFPASSTKDGIKRRVPPYDKPQETKLEQQRIFPGDSTKDAIKRRVPPYDAPQDSTAQNPEKTKGLTRRSSMLNVTQDALNIPSNGETYVAEEWNKIMHRSRSTQNLLSENLEDRSKSPSPIVKEITLIDGKKATPHIHRQDPNLKFFNTKMLMTF